MSRKHALLRIGDEMTIEDAHSRHGTRVGGRKLAPGKPVPFARGQVLEIGAVKIVLEAARRPGWRVQTFERLGARLADACARDRRQRDSFAVLRLEPAAAGASLDDELLGDLRADDVVARDGAGYDVLLALLSPVEAAEVAARIRARAEGAGTPVRVGVANFPADGQTAEALLAAARADAVRPPPDGAMIAVDPAMTAAVALVDRVAPSDISVILLGETGVGKEVLAQRLRRGSPRRAGPLVTVNCAALPEALLESELFGYDRGAFTGAHQVKPGLLEMADRGTLLLDEIGELPLGMQAKLLRVVEERQVTRLGGVQPRRIDVRFVAATNRDLEAEAAAGRFRRDLYYRLNGISIRIPPLRERPGDVRPLAQAFLDEACGGGAAPQLSAAAAEVLMRHLWPGNVRELRNVIRRAAVLATGGVIAPEHLHVDGGAAAAAAPTTPPGATPSAATPSAGAGEAQADLDSVLGRTERERILRALESCAGNQSEAARRLGISRSRLIRRLEEYRLARPRKR